MRMAIDPFKVVARTLSKVKKKPSVNRIIAIDYDEKGRHFIREIQAFKDGLLM